LSVASDSIPLLSQILARNPIRRTLVFRINRAYKRPYAQAGEWNSHIERSKVIP
jgi:hypothetical protein